MPVVADPQSLGCGRLGEGSRSWSAGAGAGVLATGLVQVVWLLQQIRERVDDPACHVYLRWSDAENEKGHFEKAVAVLETVR